MLPFSSSTRSLLDRPPNLMETTTLNATGDSSLGLLSATCMKESIQADDSNILWSNWKQKYKKFTSPETPNQELETVDYPIESEEIDLIKLDDEDLDKLDAEFEGINDEYNGEEHSHSNEDSDEDLSKENLIHGPPSHHLNSKPVTDVDTEEVRNEHANQDCVSSKAPAELLFNAQWEVADGLREEVVDGTSEDSNSLSTSGKKATFATVDYKSNSDLPSSSRAEPQGNENVSGVRSTTTQEDRKDNNDTYVASPLSLSLLQEKLLPTVGAGVEGNGLVKQGSVPEAAKVNPFDNSSCDEMKDINLSEEFMSSANALEVLAKDQEDFENEHRFIKEDAMRSYSMSSSWALPPSNQVPRPSWMTEDSSTSSRVSVGKYFWSRSKPLCNSLNTDPDDDNKGDNNLCRPSFGFENVNSPVGVILKPVRLFSGETSANSFEFFQDSNAEFQPSTAVKPLPASFNETKIVDIADTRRQQQQSANDSTAPICALSASGMDEFFRNLSLHTDPNTAQEKIFSFAREWEEIKKRKRQFQPLNYDNINTGNKNNKNYNMSKSGGFVGNEPSTAISVNQQQREMGNSKAEGCPVTYSTATPPTIVSPMVATPFGQQLPYDCHDPLQWDVDRPSTIPSDSVCQFRHHGMSYCCLDTPVTTKVGRTASTNSTQLPFASSANRNTDVRFTSSTSTPFVTPEHGRHNFRNFAPHQMFYKRPSNIVKNELLTNPRALSTVREDENSSGQTSATAGSTTAAAAASAAVASSSNVVSSMTTSSTIMPGVTSEYGRNVSEQHQRRSEQRTLFMPHVVESLPPPKLMEPLLPPHGRRQRMEPPVDHSFHPLKSDSTVDSDVTCTDLYLSSNMSQSRLNTDNRPLSVVVLNRVVELDIPELVRFESPVCIGVEATKTFTMFNPISEWIDCSFTIQSLTIDGVKCHKEQCPFQFKPKIEVEPSSSEDIKVKFLSYAPGKIVATYLVRSETLSAAASSNHPPSSSSPASTERSTVRTAELKLTAEAERPNIEVFLGSKKELDFGMIPVNTCLTQTLGLTNKGLSPVPLRIVINEDSSRSKGFHFTKRNVKCSSPPERKLSSYQTLTCILPGYHVGESPKMVEFFVGFSSQPLKPGEMISFFTGSVRVELDVPAVGGILKTIPVKASVGIAQLVTKAEVDPVRLKAVVGYPVTQRVPLRNTGSISLALSLTVSQSSGGSGEDGGGELQVNPMSCQLEPGDEIEIEVNFTPHQSTPERLETKLQIVAYPGQLKYELNVIAKNVPPIILPQDFNFESDRQFLSWSGVDRRNKYGFQTIKFRNYSKLGSAYLSLKIHHTERGFAIVSGNKLLYNTIVKMEPLSDISVTLCYQVQSSATSTTSTTATRTSNGDCSKLVVRPFERPAVRQLLPFSVPLFGYGLGSFVSLVSHDSLFVHVGSLQPGSTKRQNLVFRNDGERAAYCKLLINNGGQSLTDTEVILSASEFVLEAGQTVSALAAIRTPITSVGSAGQQQPLCVATVDVYTGDEVDRRRYRRWLRVMNNGKLHHKGNFPIRRVNFDVEYRGESSKISETDLPKTSDDCQVFFADMTCFRIWLLSDGSSYSSQSSNNSEALLHEVRRTPPTRETTTSLNPVRGPAPTSVNTTDSFLMKASSAAEVFPSTSSVAAAVREVSAAEVEADVSWEVNPRKLVFDQNLADSNVEYMTVSNRSDREIRFEVEWPSNLMNILPLEGSVPPRSSLTVTVVLTEDFFNTRQSWATNQDSSSCQIIFSSRNSTEKKVVTVEICDGKKNGGSEGDRREANGRSVESLGNGEGSGSSPITVRTKKFVFPDTPVIARSELHLEMSNGSDQPRVWNLSYASVSRLTNSGGDYNHQQCRQQEEADEYNVPVSATIFRFDKLNGLLDVGESVSIPVAFFPMDEGSYSQTWELMSEGPNLKRHTTVVQLFGKGVMKSGIVETSHSRGVVWLERKEEKRRVRKQKKQGPVYTKKDVLKWPVTNVGKKPSLKLEVCNASDRAHTIELTVSVSRARVAKTSPQAQLRDRDYLQSRDLHHHRRPDGSNGGNYGGGSGNGGVEDGEYVVLNDVPSVFVPDKWVLTINAGHYVRIPVHFKPPFSGSFEGTVVVKTDLGYDFSYALTGVAID